MRWRIERQQKRLISNPCGAARRLARAARVIARNDRDVAWNRSGTSGKDDPQRRDAGAASNTLFAVFGIASPVVGGATERGSAVRTGRRRNSSPHGALIEPRRARQGGLCEAATRSELKDPGAAEIAVEASRRAAATTLRPTSEAASRNQRLSPLAIRAVVGYGKAGAYRPG